MDVETTQAVEQIESRFDRLEPSLRQAIESLGDDLALNWSRAQLLFEAVRDDIKKLGEGSSFRSRKKPRR